MVRNMREKRGNSSLAEFFTFVEFTSFGLFVLIFNIGLWYAGVVSGLLSIALSIQNRQVIFRIIILILTAGIVFQYRDFNPLGYFYSILGFMALISSLWDFFRFSRNVESDSVSKSSQYDL